MRKIAGLAIAIFLMAACGSDTYEMKQKIEMGPFVFEVTNASERVEFFTGGGRHKRIYVDLLLHTDKSSPSKVGFKDFMNGGAKEPRMIVFPAMKIVDDHGKKFDGLVNRVSGDTYWQAEFLLVDFRRGIKSGLDYTDRHIHNFQLVIKNPDPRKGQPSRVTIKLQ